VRGLLIAGGGTGGHIYPAIAIAQAAMKMEPALKVDFVGTNKGLETKIVVRENFPLHFVTVGALNSVGILTKALTLLSLPYAIVQAMGFLFKLKPRSVIGVGGYASGPMMIAALLLKPILHFKVALFEANAFPGLTNRWLSKKADIAFTNFEVSNSFFKRPMTVGIPIRSGLSSLPRPPHPRFRILIFGGSQGARGINYTVLDAVKSGGSWLDDVEVIHQIGSADFKKFDEEYKKINPENIRWFEFLYDMPERYAWADLVICRAGASTLAELAACQKAAVLIPFPFAADNHQQENAETLERESAALVILQKNFTSEKLMETVIDFKKNPQQISVFERRIGMFFKPRSAERVAEVLLGVKS
jgi:UDP-N-acetylglucosamine--N-acetylmuramyl-(pentapeptide) pyrophosphoryl-undecaprenol N-acetylglucosamine transferase